MLADPVHELTAGSLTALYRFFGRPAPRDALPVRVRSWLSVQQSRLSDSAAGLELARPLRASVDGRQLVLRHLPGLNDREDMILLDERPLVAPAGTLQALGLTDREVTVVRLLGTGASNVAIAQRLSLSAWTVKRHLANIYAKLGVQSRTSAAALVLEIDAHHQAVGQPAESGSVGPKMARKGHARCAGCLRSFGSVQDRDDNCVNAGFAEEIGMAHRIPALRRVAAEITTIGLLVLSLFALPPGSAGAAPGTNPTTTLAPACADPTFPESNTYDHSCTNYSVAGIGTVTASPSLLSADIITGTPELETFTFHPADGFCTSTPFPGDGTNCDYVDAWSYNVAAASVSTGITLAPLGLGDLSSGCIHTAVCTLRLHYPDSSGPDLYPGMWLAQIMTVFHYVNGSAVRGYQLAAPFQIAGAPTTDTPVAAFTASPSSPKDLGQYQFVSSSTDPAGEVLSYSYSFGDGSKAIGAAATHSYTKPGTFHATLTVTNADGVSTSVAHDIVVAAPKLETGVVFVDAHGVTLDTASPKIGDTVRVKLTVSATTGLGSINGITFADPKTLSVTPAAVAALGAPTPSLPSPFTLAAATSKSFVFPATVKAAGVAQFSVTPSGTDDSGETVLGTTGQRSFSVSALTVVMSVNPPTFTLDEDAAGPKPVDVTVTETITNTSGETVTGVNVNSLEPQRVDQGQLLAVTYKSGADPDPLKGLPLDPIAAGGHKRITAVFTVTDDGKVDFTSLVTATTSDGSALRALGTARLEADPKYYLRFSSHVVNPPGGTLLPAGTPITVTGSVHNLSDSATEDVGPMFAKVAGNAGLQGLSYDGVGVDPKSLTSPGKLTLDPGDTKNFTLKVLTAYSDPISGNGGPSRSGGTSATITFAPWATVTRDDGTTFTTNPDTDILSTADDLSHRVGIDDSIVIPRTNGFAVAGGLAVGGVQGLWNAASGMVTGLISLPGLSSSTVYAVTQYQSEVWDSFTEAQKQQFAVGTASLVVPVLEANVGLAAEGAAQLFNKASGATYHYFTTLDNDWHVGNYAKTVEDYTALSTDAVGQFVVPWAIGKLATSSDAVRAVEATQQLENASATEAASAITDASSAPAVAESVSTIKSGAQLFAGQIAKLFGIGPDELASLQALATKYDFLLVVRSRAASSLDWINDFAAMLKPEALKIKTVSELDTRLGYDAKYVGSLVLKEPAPLIEYNKSGGDLAELVRGYVEGQGFAPNDVDYNDAVSRVTARIAEWNKYAETYESWSKRGWIDVSFNWEGNAMSDPTVSGSGKFAGFQLEPVGVTPVGETPTEFVVQMYNQRVGRFVPVTGDVDPIAFTHVDGTPLTAQEHAALLNDMRRDPNLQTQHGESATYVNGGVDFIASQFKPGEAALMIGPGDSAPRAVRFDVRQSTWKSATDYHLVWDKGVIDAGAEPPTTGSLDIDYSNLERPASSAPAGVTLPLPGDGATDGANVGRCAMTYTATGANATSLEMTAAGSLGQINGITVQTSPLEATCFTEGPVVPVSIRPVTTISDNVTAGQREIPVQTGEGVSGNNTNHGFAVGQQVSINPGGSDAETGTISAFGSIILTSTLKNAHQAGEVIVVIAATGSAPVSGILAATGLDALSIDLGGGLALMITGSVLLTAGTRRRRRDHINPS